MLSFVAFGLLIIILSSLVFAFKGEHRMYWITALATYLFSFLAGFSIGQLTVGFTFVFVTLAIAYRFHWIQNGVHYIAFLVTGLVIGGLAITYIDDFWLFFPFALLG